MPLVFPKQSGGGFLDPSLYLGTYVNQDPNTYAEGNWWYRVDLGTIYTYINGQVLPAISSSATVIDSNATYTNTVFSEDVIILPNVTVTIYGNVTFLKNLVILGTLQSSNPNASSSSTENNNYYMYGIVYIQGTYSVAQYNNDNIYSQSIIYGQGTISGAGTLNINKAESLYIGSGYTLTIATNLTVTCNIIGSGTLTINSGYTLTVNGNITLSIPTIFGAGTLTISSGYTLTQATNITFYIPTVNINGTWANAGYTITVPSGVTITFNQPGSLTTGSTAGTLTVNGTVYWYGGITGTTNMSSSPSLPSFPLNINGTGIFVGSFRNGGTATNTFSLSSTSLSKGSYTSSSVSSTGGIQYFSLSTISGSAVGKYGLGFYLNDGNPYYQSMVLIYIGTANTNFTVSGNWGSTFEIASGISLYVYNNGNSAGTITLTGTLYA
jgi:hypothetical protein